MVDFKPRAAERRRCYLAARFIFNGGRGSLDAIVRNISPLGARIETENACVAPGEFDLQMPHSKTHRARRIWAHDSAMGVAFVA